MFVGLVQIECANEIIDSLNDEEATRVIILVIIDIQEGEISVF